MNKAAKHDIQISSTIAEPAKKKSLSSSYRLQTTQEVLGSGRENVSHFRCAIDHEKFSIFSPWMARKFPYTAARPGHFQSVNKLKVKSVLLIQLSKPLETCRERGEGREEIIIFIVAQKLFPLLLNDVMNKCMDITRESNKLWRTENSLSSPSMSCRCVVLVCIRRLWLYLLHPPSETVNSIRQIKNTQKNLLNKWNCFSRLPPLQYNNTKSRIAAIPNVNFTPPPPPNLFPEWIWGIIQFDLICEKCERKLTPTHTHNTKIIEIRRGEYRFIACCPSHTADKRQSSFFMTLQNEISYLFAWWTHHLSSYWRFPRRFARTSSETTEKLSRKLIRISSSVFTSVPVHFPLDII